MTNLQQGDGIASEKRQNNIKTTYSEQLESSTISPSSRPLINVHQPSPRTAETPKVALANSTEWKEFHEEGNEMFVSNSGRELYPLPKYKIENLDPLRTYVLGLRLVHLGNEQKNKRKFSKVSEVEKETNEIFTLKRLGNELMKEDVEFKHPKIYNIGMENKKNIPLRKPVSTEALKRKERREKMQNKETMMKVTSKNKYIPIMTIYEVDNITGNYTKVGEYIFEEMSFLVVTAYRSKKIIAMKSANKYCRHGVRSKALKESEESATLSLSTTSSDNSSPIKTPSTVASNPLVLAALKSPSDDSSSTSVKLEAMLSPRPSIPLRTHDPFALHYLTLPLASSNSLTSYYPYTNYFQYQEVLPILHIPNGNVPFTSQMQFSYVPCNYTNL